MAITWTNEAKSESITPSGAMPFSDTTNLTGLIQKCELLTGLGNGVIASNTVLLKQFTALINDWYDKVATWIWDSCGTWEWDDEAQDDFPLIYTTIVDEQRDYPLPVVSHEIIRVEVKNSSGDWFKLTYKDRKKSNLGLWNENAALPNSYYFVGNTIMLYPKPDTAVLTASGGLRVYMGRSVVQFANDDTTKVPGFDREFHKILAYGASLDYAEAKGLQTLVNNYNAKIYGKGSYVGLKKELEDWYSRKNQDERKKITRKRHRII